MKKESAVFVRIPIMVSGILLLTCSCALAQKELVIEYTAESERMRCTIEEFVQNGDEIKYSVQDEPADIQIMTYKQMRKAAENGDILPIEIDDVSSTVKFGNDVYGCAIKNYRTEFKAQHLELWKKMGLSVPEKELNWDILLEIADKVSDYASTVCLWEQGKRIPKYASIKRIYLDVGTYVKSFYSVMTMPSCVTVAMMGETHRRMHHNISWVNCVPMILNEKYRKAVSPERVGDHGKKEGTAKEGDCQAGI